MYAQIWFYYWPQITNEPWNEAINTMHLLCTPNVGPFTDTKRKHTAFVNKTKTALFHVNNEAGSHKGYTKPCSLWINIALHFCGSKWSYSFILVPGVDFQIAQSQPHFTWRPKLLTTFTPYFVLESGNLME